MTAQHEIIRTWCASRGQSEPSNGDCMALVAALTANGESMTLRDHFAAAATENDVANYIEGPIVHQVVEDIPGRKRVISAPLKRTREQAKYAYADAMIEVRSA